MEAAAIKICSRCGRTGIAASSCPDCGAPTFTPAGAAPVGVLFGPLFVTGRAVRDSVPSVKRLVAGLGAFVAVAALYRMINQPDPAAWFTVGPGAWMALVGGAAMALGGGLKMGARQT